MLLPNRLRKFLKQRELLHFYKNYIKPGSLCFDVGANIGERTNIFLKLGAKVIAVEPQRTCIEILEKKFRGNKNFTLIRSAAGNEPGETQLMICNETNECATLSDDFIKTYSHISGFHWTSSEKINVITLEKLIAEYGIPDLCKIDVEGFESEVFLGLKTPLKFISFEFNRPLLKDTIRSLDIAGRIADYKCNFISYEFMKPVMKEWMPILQFKSNIEELITEEIMTGEILLLR